MKMVELEWQRLVTSVVNEQGGITKDELGDEQVEQSPILHNSVM